MKTFTLAILATAAMAVSLNAGPTDAKPEFRHGWKVRYNHKEFSAPKKLEKGHVNPLMKRGMYQGKDGKFHYDDGTLATKTNLFFANAD
jgi:hypothetical protein